MDRSSSDSPPDSPPDSDADVSSPSIYLEPISSSNSSDSNSNNSHPLSDTAVDHLCRDNHPPTDIDHTSGRLEQLSGHNYASAAIAHGSGGVKQSGWFFYNQRCASRIYRQTTMLPPLVWEMDPPETTPIILVYLGGLCCFWTNSVDKKLWWAHANLGFTKFFSEQCLEPVPAHESFAVAQRNGILHIVIVAGCKFDHFVIQSLEYSRLRPLSRCGSPCTSARPVSRPSLAIFRGVLFLAWIGHGKPWYATLAAEPPCSWSRPIRVKAGVDLLMRFQEAPALLVWHNRLFLHCVSQEGVPLCCEYSYRTATWLPCERYPTQGTTIETLGAIHDGSVTSYGDTNYLASFELIDNGDHNQTTRVAVRSFTKDKLN
jgi:hypothetical protein